AGAFVCPSQERGLPAANAAPQASDPGQTLHYPGVVDDQVARISYTVNEAIVPRNKFKTPKTDRSSGQTPARFVKAGMIRGTQETILATEFWENWKIITDPGDDATVCKSHRPVHAYKGASDELNINDVPRPTFG